MIIARACLREGRSSQKQQDHEKRPTHRLLTSKRIRYSTPDVLRKNVGDDD
jgi:hypothetical protein